MWSPNVVIDTGSERFVDLLCDPGASEPWIQPQRERPESRLAAAAHRDGFRLHQPPFID